MLSRAHARCLHCLFSHLQVSTPHKTHCCNQCPVHTQDAMISYCKDGVIQTPTIAWMSALRLMNLPVYIMALVFILQKKNCNFISEISFFSSVNRNREYPRKIIFRVCIQVKGNNSLSLMYQGYLVLCLDMHSRQGNQFLKK